MCVCMCTTTSQHEKFKMWVLYSTVHTVQYMDPVPREIHADLQYSMWSPL